MPMQRLMRTGLALGLVAVAASGAEAQMMMARPRVSLAAGVALPVAPAHFTDDWGAHVALAAGLHWRLSPRVGGGLEVGYNRFGASRRDDFAVVPVTLQADVALRGRGTTRPVAILGGGWYRLTSSDFSEQVDGLGLHFGAGVRTALTPGSILFLDAIWHVVWYDADSIQFVPLRVGVRF